MVKSSRYVGPEPDHFHMLSLNLGSSTSWKPQGLSRPVQGLLALLKNGKSRRTRYNSGGRGSVGIVGRELEVEK